VDDHAHARSGWTAAQMATPPSSSSQSGVAAAWITLVPVRRTSKKTATTEARPMAAIRLRRPTCTLTASAVRERGAIPWNE
jgi:hypothetical protein